MTLKKFQAIAFFKISPLRSESRELLILKGFPQIPIIYFGHV